MGFVDKVKIKTNIKGVIPQRLTKVISEFENFSSIYLGLAPNEVRVNNFVSCFNSNSNNVKKFISFKDRPSMRYKLGLEYQLIEPAMDLSDVDVLDFNKPNFFEIKSYDNGVNQVIKSKSGMYVQKTGSLLKGSHSTDRVVLLLSSLDEYVDFANLQNSERKIEKDSMLAFVVAGDRYF